MLDLIAFLLLMGLFFAFASKRYVGWLQRVGDCRRNQSLIAWSLLLPLVLVTLPLFRRDLGRFLDELGTMALWMALLLIVVLYRPVGANSLHPLDIAAILLFWLPVEYDLLPEIPIVLAAGVELPGSLLVVINTAFLTYLVFRPLPRLGYHYGQTVEDGRTVLKALVGFGVVGIPVGLLTGFLTLQLNDGGPVDWLLRFPLIFLFNALPEELLFRGVIQQQLADRLGKNWQSLLIAAVIFGAAHYNNPTPGFPEPNWMYVIMASIAGVAYGWAYRRSGKITTAGLVHAGVNFLWASFLRV